MNSFETQHPVPHWVKKGYVINEYVIVFCFVIVVIAILSYLKHLKICQSKKTDKLHHVPSMSYFMVDEDQIEQGLNYVIVDQKDLEQRWYQVLSWFFLFEQVFFSHWLYMYVMPFQNLCIYDYLFSVHFLIIDFACSLRWIGIICICKCLLICKLRCTYVVNIVLLQNYLYLYMFVFQTTKQINPLHLMLT